MPGTRLFSSAHLAALLALGALLWTSGEPVPRAGLAPGDTTYVFGPVQKAGTPSGSGSTYIESFTAPALPGQLYTLHIINGNTNGTNRANRVTATLNGAQVVGPSDVTTATAQVSRVVAVTPTDTLRLTVRGPAGSFVRVAVFSTPDPNFNLFGPNQYAITSGTSATHTASFTRTSTAVGPFRLFVVNGAANGTGRVNNFTVSVTSPGNSASVAGAGVGSIMREIPVGLGTSNVSIQLSGPTQSFITLRITATDTTKPLLTITTPAPGTVTRTTSIEVTGTVQASTPVSVTVNGVAATVTNNTSYAATVPLPNEGSNTLTVSAVASGAQVDSIRTVIRDTQAPALTLTSPTDGLVTKVPTVTVSGTVVDATAVTVNTNGTPWTVGAEGAFSGSFTLSDGPNVLTTTATDAAGNTSSQVRTVTLDSVPPVLVVNQPADGSTTTSDSATVSGTVTDQTAVTVTANGTALAVGGSGAFTGKVGLVEGPNTISVVATDAASNATTVVRTVTPEGDEEPLPPDPSTVAPSLDLTAPSTLGTSTEFLYTGSNPIQTGVAPGTIREARATLVSGRVLDRQGAPLAGATVAVLNQPELGQTLSRADGRYDLVVNGGGELTLRFSRQGHLPSQRQVRTEWQEGITLDDVVLVTPDPLVTTINFTQPIEIARGSAVTDGHGTRQASLMFRANTQATMVMPDGSAQSLPAMNVRITEYTVGATGPAAMPAALPATSAYTYAANLGVDEATVAGAKEVVFDQPVAFYVANFTGIPVGQMVPVGNYDPAKGNWVPEPDGRVVKILDKVDGRAVLAVTRDSGQAASQAQLDALGITTAELDKLGADPAYAVGTTWWRTQHTHFSIIDWNYILWIAQKAFEPVIDFFDPKVEKPNCTGGSVIGCENQTLGEVLPIAGTPFSLRYQSDRTAGYQPDAQITIPGLQPVDTSGLLTLARNRIPNHARAVSFSLEIVGARTVTARKTVLGPVSATTLAWNGLDFANRPVNGRRKASLIASICYPTAYSSSDIAVSGGSFGAGGGGGPTAIVSQSTRPECISVSRTVWNGTVGAWSNVPLGLGGWSLDANHVYEPATGTLYLGNGEQRTASVVGNTIAHIPSTNGFFCTAFNCGVVISDRANPGRLTVAPDGSLYIPYAGEQMVRRLSPEGDTLTAFITSITDVRATAWGPDGSLYLAQGSQHRVRRRMPDGSLVVVAGTGVAGSAGDGGPAAAAQLSMATDVAVAPDGSLFIVEFNGHGVRRVAPNGIITRFAGNGTTGTTVEGARAESTPLTQPETVAPDVDGSVYVATSSVIWRVDTDGLIRKFAGGTTGATQALRTPLSGISQIAITPERSLLVATNATIYRMGPDGSVEILTGRNRPRCIPLIQSVHCLPYSDGDIAGQTYLEGGLGAALRPDGVLYVSDAGAFSNKHFIRRVRPAMPGVAVGTMLVASESGEEVYQFDATGRHRLTRDPVTGDTLLAFIYDGDGRLETIRDGSGNVTTIERSATTGQATAIVGPFGQRSTLQVDGGGYLRQVTDPAGQRTRLYHRSNGLLDSLVTPRNRTHTFEYNAVGHLIKDSDPAGGSKTLVRTVGDTSTTVAISTELGRTTRYTYTQLPGRAERRQVVTPTGLARTTTRLADGTTSRQGPDGTVLTAIETADPRYGAQAPFLGRASVRLPSGDSSVVTLARSVSLATGTDPFSLRGARDTLRLNGEAFVTQDTLLNGFLRRTHTTPEGRQAFARFDSLGRVRMTRVAGLDSVTYRYDVRGRLDQIKVGGRIAGYTYDTKGRLATATDPLGRIDSLFYDDADRLIRQVLPGGRTVEFAYDSSGNLTSLTPPGRPAHGFAATAVDLDSVYTPPAPGSGTWATEYRYNKDRQLTEVRRPDGNNIGFGYDATTGRPSTLTFDRGTLSFGYSSTTGQLTSMTAPGGAGLAFTYDGLLPKTVTWSGPVAGSVGVGYNTDFRVSSQTVNGANPISFGYDRDGLLTSAGALGLKRGAQTGFLERDSVGSVLGAWGYDSKGVLSSYSATAGGTTLFQTSYVRDSLSRITQLTETVQGVASTVQFTYDSAGRLATVRRGGTLTASYRYDANGNRLDVTTPGGVVSGSYDSQDRLTSYGGATYSYSANGELREKVTGNDTTRYTYDALGNLTQVRQPAGTLIEYVIDAQNRRIGKKVGGVLVQGLLYQSQLAPVAELDGSGQVVSRFVYATRGNVPDYLVKGGQTYRLVLDHLGSVRLVVNASDGTVAQRIDYDEFGQVTQNTSPGFQPFGYAGGVYDQQTELVRFGARDYDAETGRWTAKDPVGFAAGEPNLYAYVANDPVNRVDPSGLLAVPEGSQCDLFRNRLKELRDRIRKWYRQYKLAESLRDARTAVQDTEADRDALSDAFATGSDAEVIDAYDQHRDAVAGAGARLAEAGVRLYGALLSGVLELRSHFKDYVSSLPIFGPQPYTTPDAPLPIPPGVLK